MSEPADSHQYSWLLLKRHTVEFLKRATGFYARLLDAEVTALEQDEELAALIGKEEFGRSRIARASATAKRYESWLTSKLEDDPADRFDCTLSMSHGDVRYYKSVGLLYLKHLTLRRNAISVRPNVTNALLVDIDQRISSMEAFLNTAGVFANASLVPLLAQIETSSGQEHALGPPVDLELTLAQARRPLPVIVDSIELLDEELKSRCLDQFEGFRAAGQHHRFDTVLASATTILEDRMRRMLADKRGASGVERTNQLLGGKEPRLVVGDTAGEQEAAAALFRGTFGFIRNPVHHRLQAHYSPERTLQLLGLVDYLLGLLAAPAISNDGDAESTGARGA